VKDALPGRRAHWNTLQILKSSRAALIALDAVVLVAAIFAASAHRHAMQTVGRDSVPSIIAAEHIKSALAGMDASAANQLLDPGFGGAALQAYDSKRQETARALIKAAENITYGDAERVPIEILQLGLGTYERLIQRARDLHEGKGPSFLMAWRDAAKLLDAKLLPAAEALDGANNYALEEQYRAQSRRSSVIRGALWLLGLILTAGLAAAQIFLSNRMKRTINPFLLVATLIAAGSVVYQETAMLREQRQLHIAKDDAFTSIRALWRARADAYWANGDESRYLLEPERAAEYERTFTQKVARLRGYLVEELRNITFAGEGEAAQESLLRLNDYVKIDARLRALESNGEHPAAVALCVGTRPGQSDWTFLRLDRALGKTIEINRQAFESAVDRGFGALNGAETEASAAAATIALLIFVGLGARIKEYE
jgi:hypothetical protein